MSKEIPIYFDSVIVSSPLQEISGSSPNIGRLKVRVFTKYANRNGSYITDEVAEQLINSATKGNTPVIGFFDPETKSWASHTGPTLANGYGYVEDFLGWEPFEDSDGVTREYAVFSVVLFTDYYEEANNVLGQNQSMELDPESIKGEWAMIGDEELYVYSSARMLGFCIIGSHEPCFSVSSFFSKNDDAYKTQYEKFSSLLFDLKARVEEAEKNNEGGELPMNEFENQEQENLENDNSVVEDPQAQENIQEFENSTNEEIVESEPEIQPAEQEVETVEPAAEPNAEFVALQKQFEELQNSFTQLQNDYNAAAARMEELEQFQNTANTELEQLRAKNAELTQSVANYEAINAQIAEDKKNKLIEKYEKIILNTEEISVIKESVKDFSYEELESKLAIMYANQQMASTEETKVPLSEPEPSDSQFARLMKKYRKN